MRKVICAILCGFVLVGAAGCGAKEELKCTQQEDNESGVMVGTFEKDKLKKITMTTTAKYESTEDLEDNYEMAQFSAGVINAMQGAEAKLEKKDLSIIMESTFDLSKMSSENIKSMFEKETLNQKDFKSFAEEEGYTCK